MRKFVVFGFVFLWLQYCFGESFVPNKPDKLGVSMIGSFRGNSSYETCYITMTTPNALSWDQSTEIQCVLPITISLGELESVYLFDGSNTGTYWDSHSFGISSDHSFTATFSPPSWLPDPGPSYLNVWCKDINNVGYEILAPFMVSNTAPTISSFTPESFDAGEFETALIYTNELVTGTLITETAPFGLLRYGEQITATDWGHMSSDMYYASFWVPPSTTPGDWLLYMIYDKDDFRYNISKSIPVIALSIADLVAPENDSVVPVGDIELDWNYSGITPTGYEIWTGYDSNYNRMADVVDGSTNYTACITQTAQTYEWYVQPYLENGRRTYPYGSPQVWDFTTWDPTPPPADPIPATGGSTTLNGGASGSGVGATIMMTPTGTPPTAPINVTQTDPTTLGVPVPENALDIAFIIETAGTITDPVTIRISWDYPEPTSPTSGNPTLLVNHGDGWETHPVNDWDYDAAPYWIEFSAYELSDWAIGNGDDNPLPVCLSSFSVEYSDGHPVLHWTTQSETDNLGWFVYRSLNQNGFAENDYTKSNSEMVPGMGISTQPTEYTFVDEHPVIEGLTYYYWLQSVSTTNELELFGPKSLQIPIQGQIPHAVLETALNPNYPNPFNPSTLIRFSIEDGEKGTLSIYNIKGQIVHQAKYECGEYEMEWNAEGLASGIYLYRLKTISKDIIRKMLLMK